MAYTASEIDVLEGLEPVSALALRYAEGDALVFDLQLRGGVQNLLRALEASGRVIAEPAPPRRDKLPPLPPSAADGFC